MRYFRREIDNKKPDRLGTAVGLLTAAVACLFSLFGFFAFVSFGGASVQTDGDATLHVSKNAYDQMFEYSQIDDGILFLAAKSEKKVSPKKKSAIKSKKPQKRSSRPKRTNGFVRKRAKPTSSLDGSRRRITNDFIEYVCVGIVGFALLGLFWRYQKEFGDNQTDLRDLTNAPPIRSDQYHAKPVILSGPGGPDPMTFERTDVFQRVAGKGKPSVALDLSLDGTELNNGISEEIDDIISTIKVKSAGGEGGSPSAPLLLLPAEMLGHFEGLPGESLVWSAPIYIKGVCEGMMAITTHRILALYEKRRFKLWLPSVVFQTRRNQVQLQNLSLYKPIQVNRPSFLAAGGFIFWWFPFGTVGACLTIGAFLFLTRRELGVWTSGQKKTYPLSMVDLEEAMSAIRSVTGIQPLGRSESNPPMKKVNKAG